MGDLSRKIGELEKRLTNAKELLSFERCLRFQYAPHGGQRPFHEARDVKHRALIGGTGAGKTIAGVFETLWYVYTFPGIVGCAVEPNYPMINRNLIPTLERLLGAPIESNPLVLGFNKSESRLDFVNGSRLWLGSLDRPESLEGMNLDFVYVDEARLVEDLVEARQVIIRRLRGSGGDYPRRSWWTTTPDHPGSTLFNMFENPHTKLEGSRVFRMSIYDNSGNLADEAIKQIEREHTGGYADRFIYGRFASVGSGGLKFDSTIHVVDDGVIDGERWLEDASGHGIIPLKAFESYSYGHDFGWTNSAAQVAVAWDGDGRAYALDEYYKSHSTRDELLDSALRLQGRYDKGDWYCDPSEPEMIKHLGEKIYARKHDGKREDGIRELGSRLAKQGDGRCRLYVHSRCKNLISEMLVYDPEKKHFDHAIDALRYAVVGGKTNREPIQISFARRPR